ncbi:MAG: sigma-70 family RNA polymerase sigma factor [Pseudomonadota bacterium]
MSIDAILTGDSLLAGRKQLRRWLGSTADADEVTQTVGEKLLKTGVKPNPAYLFTMYRNAAVDAIRAETTRREYEAEYARHAETVEQQTPERRLASTQALEALQSAVASLSPLNREIFVRAYVDDQPRAHIADALGLRLSTVEKRLAKAKSHCMARIQHHLA